ncbi:MAG: YdcF family protein [Bdellovibrionota bacterium]
MAEHNDGGSSLASRQQNANGPKHRSSIWAGAISILLLLAIIGIRVGGDTLYDYPANPAPLAFPKDTVIVCLAGGKHRIEAAYSLFADGVGEQLWIVGAGKHATVMGLARAQAGDVAQKIPWDRFDKIQVETESRNTIENAFAVHRMLGQNPNFKNVVLVTSPYHMRRSMLMIAHHIAPGINIIPFTPISADFGRGDWWQSWSGISLTVAETVKFELAALLVPRLSYF